MRRLTIISAAIVCAVVLSACGVRTTWGYVGDGDAPIGDSAGTVGEPLPVGPDYVFEQHIGNGTAWGGHVVGLTEASRAVWNNDAGECYIVLAVVTAIEIADGTTTGPGEAPAFELYAGGRAYDPSPLNCDLSDAKRAGYVWARDAEVAAGTEIAVFQAYFVPAGDGDVDAIVAGDSAVAEAVFYRPERVELGGE